ncbi:hypothetical protein [Streptomyces lydicus]|uniref:hypothetical protein n=1 Tax=Streptomyces lydicus TaxID=47763 RepID=UPI0037AE9BC3
MDSPPHPLAQLTARLLLALDAQLLTFAVLADTDVDPDALGLQLAHPSRAFDSALSDVHTQCAATNVAGQSVIPILVSAKEKILDREAYARATSIRIGESETGNEAGSRSQAEPVPAGAAS